MCRRGRHRVSRRLFAHLAQRGVVELVEPVELVDQLRQPPFSGVARFIASGGGGGGTGGP